MRSAEDAVLVPGVELAGKYRIERLIGRGGMGEVYLARNQFLDQHVAIKVLPLRRSGEDHWKERMRREAQAGARLAHENLVRVIDGGMTDDNLVYIVMEYLDGAKTLRELVWRSRGFEVQDALAYAIQLLDGLAAVHAAGILHRDLKPENVVVLPGGVVKIIDFGLAKIRTSSLRTTVVPEGQRMGTLHYMAPEQIFGGDVGPPADVYAAGLILHEMVAGRHVFQQETDVLPSVQEVSIMHQLARPARLDAAGVRVPKELADVVERMLAKEPAARPSALEAGAALERVLAEAARGAPAPAKQGVHGTMMLPEGFVPPNPLGSFAPAGAVVTLCARAMERALAGSAPAGGPVAGAGWPPPAAGSGPAGAGPGWASASSAGAGPIHMPSMPTPSPVTSTVAERPGRAGPVVAGVLVGALLVAAGLGGMLHLRARAGGAQAVAGGPDRTSPDVAEAPGAAPTALSAATAAPSPPTTAAASGAADAATERPAASAPEPAASPDAAPPTSASVAGPASGSSRGAPPAAPRAPAAPVSRPPHPPRGGMPGSGL